MTGLQVGRDFASRSLQQLPEGSRDCGMPAGYGEYSGLTLSGVQVSIRLGRAWNCQPLLAFEYQRQVSPLRAFSRKTQPSKLTIEKRSARAV